MNNADDAAFKTMPHPPRKRLVGSRLPPTRFELWAWGEVISFQIGLTAGYIGLVYFGIASIAASVPSIQQTSPRGFTLVWAIALVVGAVIAAVGSISRRPTFMHIELLGSGLVSLTVGSYAVIITVVAFLLGDTGRISASAGFTALAIPLIIRTLWLASQALRKR